MEDPLPNFNHPSLSDINGDLDDVEEDRGSLALVKKRGRLGFFGFRKRKALKGKTEFGRGSFSALPATPSSSKSHFWTNVYAGLKQVVPWKNKKTTS
ncbi:unnamed protein product [Arabis nemorensis]|uniref:Uncharacterized protein n=1 Tax=Arabis nemorensis TaxID=586526 RepID=A0A565BZU3_9BRAS|nr:unnamed protein product [Arabis nemorensis]